MTFTATTERVAACVRFCQNVSDEMLAEFNERSVGVLTFMKLLTEVEWAAECEDEWNEKMIPYCVHCMEDAPTHDESCLLNQILDIHRKHGED